MIKLPPLPRHPDPHTYQWTDAEVLTMKAIQIEAARAALRHAAQLCEALWPEMHKYWGGRQARAACEDCAVAIRALKIEGETT